MIDRPIACALVSFILACGAPAGPGAEGTGAYDLPVAESTPFARADGSFAAERCMPGESRACRRYWKDVVGGMHCTESVQHCRADGRAWLVCGHPPQATDATADDPDDEDEDVTDADEGPIVR